MLMIGEFEDVYFTDTLTALIIMIVLLCLNIYLFKMKNTVVDVIFMLFGSISTIQIMIESYYSFEISIGFILLALFIFLNGLHMWGVLHD